MKYKYVVLLFLIFIAASCAEKKEQQATETRTIVKTPFDWKAANVYFLLTDRFNNGDPDNDVNFDRTRETGKLRDFKGGDITGITQRSRKVILPIWALTPFG